MTLLDFDDSYIPPFTKKGFDAPRDNFSDLQNLGHKKVSEDYSDHREKGVKKI